MMRKWYFGLLICLFLFAGCEGLESDKSGGDEVQVRGEEPSPVQTTESQAETEPSYAHLNIQSEFDYNDNGIDDFSDFVLGAQKDANIHPRYDGSYIGINGGYPTAQVGVCTDLVWRAFKEAGYSLRTMLNEDIMNHPDRYPMVEKPDPNIDSRRVKTTRPFYEAYCEVLTNDLTDPADWQPGDIVIFNPDDYHIGILSDRRNNEGFPLVFHNQGQREREEDFLPRKEVSGHYRFRGENISEDVLRAWTPNEAGESNE